MLICIGGGAGANGLLTQIDHASFAMGGGER